MSLFINLRHKKIFNVVFNKFFYRRLVIFGSNFRYDDNCNELGCGETENKTKQRKRKINKTKE